mmetsp:Transcript_6719/g.14132  ORF Transcript_6719/g.14132 Transcript_6719/m.14132 type:complete len:326 (+) Transcript_6719:276-1253(+)
MIPPANENEQSSSHAFNGHDIYFEMANQPPAATNASAAASAISDTSTRSSSPPPASGTANLSSSGALTPYEIEKLRTLLASYSPYEERAGDHQQPQQHHHLSTALSNTLSADDLSTYSVFHETTHAWAVFADKPTTSKKLARTVGTIIIAFQLFAYWLFAAEAIEDYQKGVVSVYTTHEYCMESNEAPGGNFLCEAERTNNLDAFVAFFMLGIFLAADVQQSARAIMKAQSKSALAFACLAAIEVIAAFLAASVSISQKLYIGEVTDAVEVGVGLLFIRELSNRAYHGICLTNKKKNYRSFFLVLVAIVTVGLLVDPICEALFAP